MKNNQDQKRLQHRHDILSQLRQGIGSPRQESVDAQINALNQAREVLKVFAQEEKLRRSQELSVSVSDENSDGEDAVNNLLTETPVADTIKQLHQQIKAKQILRQQLEENPDLGADVSFSPDIQQQLVSQLLSSDFLKNTQLWLSSTTEPGKEVTSTSLEELEECQKQAQYRLKVLQILSQETQRELDHLELQIRMSQGLFDQAKE